MAVHRVRRGLQLPITGEPEQVVERTVVFSRVALLGADYVGLRPTLSVAEGDQVRRGQLLFEDKKIPGVRVTAPGEGRVVAVNRGERRAFQSLVIELSAADRSGRGSHVRLSTFSGRHPSALDGDAIRELLLESGLWTALRARPFSRVAHPDTRPRAIFVTAMDTDPLAPDVEVVMRGREADLERGLAALGRLTDGPVFLCTSDRFSLAVPSTDRVRHERFSGRHPAGTVGVHIHTLYPAGRDRLVWHIGYQDVLAVGRLFETGSHEVERVIALAGPAVRRPRLVRARLGGSTDQLVAGGELEPGAVRVVSGSALSGRTAMGPVHGFLGRYHRQVAALFEGGSREFVGWATPGLRKFSATRAFLSRLRPRRQYPLTTAVNGSPRAIIPIGLYEHVLPFDVPPAYLLKALVSHDVERAEQLGCLEFDEEDLALCTFVCPGKNDYGSHLREVLTTIEKEG